jgi:hypothetical protein
MRQSSAEALVTEEPYALIAHVRVCGGAGWVTTGSTRKDGTTQRKPPEVTNPAMTSVTPVCTLADLILYACSFAH